MMDAFSGFSEDKGLCASCSQCNDSQPHSAEQLAMASPLSVAWKFAWKSFCLSTHTSLMLSITQLISSFMLLQATGNVSTL